MTQRTTFTREMVVEAAFALTRQSGWSNVTARTIAQKLGSSTMPLYSSLKSMVEIEKEVRKKGQELMQEYQRRPFAEERLLSSAIGYVVFARDEPNLFRFLFVDRPVVVEDSRELGQARDVRDLGGVVDLADQASTALQDPLVLKSWIFTHGLASLISGGVIDLTNERISELLIDAGTGFYLLAELQRKNKKEEKNE